MKPVPSLKGEEDRAVSEHIDKFCKTDTVIYTNSCSFGKCKKRELVPFNCSTCKNNFCLKHRHFDVHQCKGRPQDNKRDILAWVLKIVRLNNQFDKLPLSSQAAIRRAQGNQGHQTDNFRNIQGTMSEDEALARALAASMQQNPQQSSVTVGGGGSSGDKKCAIS